MILKLIVFLQLITVSFAQMSSTSYNLTGGINSTVGLSASSNSILGGSFGEYHTDGGILQSSNYRLLPFSSVIHSLEISDIQLNDLLPSEFGLSQNFPNPFNPITTISYQLPKSAFVNLSIYNISGQLVETLLYEQVQPGKYTVKWDAKNFSSGVYFYKIVAGKYLATGKAILLK